LIESHDVTDGLTDPAVVLTTCKKQGSKWDGMGRYYGPAPAFPWPPGKHISTFLRKDIPVCFTGTFLTFRQLLADVYVD